MKKELLLGMMFLTHLSPDDGDDSATVVFKVGDFIGTTTVTVEETTRIIGDVQEVLSNSLLRQKLREILQEFKITVDFSKKSSICDTIYIMSHEHKEHPRSGEVITALEHFISQTLEHRNAIT